MTATLPKPRRWLWPLLISLLAALLILGGIAVVSSRPPDPNAGRYRCVGAEYQGLSMNPAFLQAEDLVLELQSGGRGLLLQGEESGLIRWSLTEDRFVLEVNGMRSEGRLSDGVIRLNLLDDGAWVTFVREDLPAPTFGPEEGALQAREAYLGDWYGWWRISDSKGELPDSWYDCFARVEAMEHTPWAVLTVWDERGSFDQALATTRLRFEQKGKRNLAISQDGFFWFEDLSDGGWTLACDGSVLHITGRHKAGGEDFEYEILLRPWGDDWEGVEAEKLPFFFESWYLDAREEAMPERPELPDEPR